LKLLAKKPLESLGALVRERRSANKLRETAAVIGIAPATLLRVEGGRIPDVVTFGKVCKWLGVDPAMFLGTDEAAKKEPAKQSLEVSAHLKADQTPKRETINALAEMILLAANAHGEEQGR
jgi:transcriptional regulator with XRE-family HTH domain